MNLYLKTTQEKLGQLQVADHFWTRLKGRMGENPQGPHSNKGLWIVPCNAVHTFGMRGALDLVFVGPDLKVLKLAFDVKPGAAMVSCFQAHSVMEFFCGHLDTSKLKVGDELQIRAEAVTV